MLVDESRPLHFPRMEVCGYPSWEARDPTRVYMLNLESTQHVDLGGNRDED